MTQVISDYRTATEQINCDPNIVLWMLVIKLSNDVKVGRTGLISCNLQSPGRESPSSTASSNTGSGSGSGIGSVSSGSGSGGSNNGCRHSTSSFDSGRASGSTIYQQGVRYSGLSSESSSGSFRHSYHSSNSSLGSIAPEDICNFDVSAMISQGIPVRTKRRTTNNCKLSEFK